MQRLAFLHHKCGTTYINRVFSKIGREAGFSYFRYHPFLDPLAIFRHTIRQRLWFQLRIPALRLFRRAQVWHVPNTHYEMIVARIRGPYRGFHVIRDPRDMIVSGYFSHRYSHPLNNPWGRAYLQAHRQWLNAVPPATGLAREIDIGYGVAAMKDWNYGNPHILEVRFEDLIRSPAHCYGKIFDHLQVRVPPAALDGVTRQLTFEKLSGGRPAGREDIRSHFRKGLPGDWRNHFNDTHKALFKARWGDVLIRLGYERDNDW